ncbi:MAG: hypothetical protein J6D29_01090 [Solobacterium sp.]|nr:hypothetical protein [Solobacterium sp.]
METIGTYLENWNSNYISLSVLITLILLTSGYFYGRLFERFAKSLKAIDATFLGFFFILSVFQFEIFWSISTKQNTIIAYRLLPILVLASPLLCLAFKAKVLPGWRHLLSLLVSLTITFVICHTSSKLTTNNTFFDTVTYLSEVIESSITDHFGYMSYANGVVIDYIDPLHDYQGFYYFFGLILRWVRDTFAIKTSLTPVYMWSATMLYGMCMGQLVASGINLLYKKWWKIAGVLISLAILAPYYTNYFNTTLAFFGNSYRPIMLGGSVLLAYLIIKEKEPGLFLPLAVTYMANICATSSGFFLSAFVTAGLLFSMSYNNVTDYKAWIGFILSCFPIFFYALFIILPTENAFLKFFGLIVVLEAVLCGVAWLIRNQFKYFNSFIRILLPIAVIGMVVVSFLIRNSSLGYAFFFETRSIDDMTVNYTTHIDDYELYRNIIFWGLVALLLVNIKVELPFKGFLIIVTLLFLNPLVQPAVSKFLTSHVYTRSFDLLANPFSLCFLAYNVTRFFKKEWMNVVITMTILPLICGVFLYLGYRNITIPYSKPLVNTEEDYNWVNKVTDNTFDLYTYVQENLIADGSRPVFLSQDISLKGYVPSVRMAFSSTDFRSSIGDEEKFKENQYEVVLLYPGTRYIDDNYFGIEPDYSKLKDIIINRQADYLIINNVLAIWNERGWWEKSYAEVIGIGLGEKIYENDTWALLKINKDYPNNVPTQEEVVEEEEAEN